MSFRKREVMRNFFDKLTSFGVMSIFAVYILFSLMLGIAKHPEPGAPRSGTIATIIEGAAWPITLLIDAMQRK